MIDLATAPELRITAYFYERIYGTAPATVRRAQAALPLLDGLTVALPWGAVVAAGPTGDRSVALYSMNHHADRFTAPTGSLTDAPRWAGEAVTALRAHSAPVPGTNLLLNRELPAETGLLTGTETITATSLALRDLHGPPAVAFSAPPAREAHALLRTAGGTEHLPCDLASAGLRLLLITLTVPRVPGPRPHLAAAPSTTRRAAAALRAGRPADLGPLLTEAHIPGCPTADLALSTALAAGALGGRSLGPTLITLTPLTTVPHIRAAVTAALTPHLPHPPRYLTTTPAPPS
ncbi:hypothetical protein [Actinomadura fibrosa]|uniref:Uncharacterized protein n=1 Tax=Actinomadura fibrosa TaxID=111802 RepID=A0ABW2XT39_9ACTN